MTLFRSYLINVDINGLECYLLCTTVYSKEQSTQM